jgi:hypothetical protein
VFMHKMFHKEMIKWIILENHHPIENQRTHKKINQTKNHLQIYQFNYIYLFENYQIENQISADGKNHIYL